MSLIALDGGARLERALIRWRYEDGSRMVAWTAASDLRGRMRRNAQARWATRGHQRRGGEPPCDGRRVSLARELGARRVAAMKRRRENGGESADRVGRQAGLMSRQGVEAVPGTGIDGGFAGQGGGEAMAVDAQSARADGGFGEARLPIDLSLFGDG